MRFRPGWQNAAIAVVASVAAVLVELLTDVHSIDLRLHRPTAPAVVITAAAPLALYWWRSHPLRALLVVTAASTVVSVSGHYVGLLPWLVAAMVCATGTFESVSRGLVGLAVALVAYTALTIAGVPDNGGDAYVSTAALFVTAWALGNGVRLRRARVAADLRAARGEADAAREEAARATTEERLRIARELHDVVAHSMSLIAVQAGVGAHVIRTRPEKAERALEVIAETSREALAQTRSLLGLLREGDRTEPTAPVPRIEELQSLCEAVERRAGLVIDFGVSGEVPPLSPAVQLATYRIVQESLTNVVKHAKARNATIRLEYSLCSASIVIVDDGVGWHKQLEPDGDRHGLRGLRERATLLGGTLEAGPVQAGGFRVAATLPLGAGAA